MSHIRLGYTIVNFETEEFTECRGTFILSQETPNKFCFEFELELVFKTGTSEILFMYLRDPVGKEWASVIGDISDSKRENYDTAQMAVLGFVSHLFHRLIVPNASRLERGFEVHDRFNCDDMMLTCVISSLTDL